MITACLGIDCQKTRLGLALVTFEAPHRPLWLATRAIYRADGGWQDAQIKDALRSVPDGHAAPEITRIAIEQPAFAGGLKQTFEAGGVYALTLAACHRIWPWAPQVPVQPSTLKKAVTGNGRASKEQVAEWARGELERWGVPESTWTKECPFQDAADALAAAYAGVGVTLSNDTAVMSARKGKTDA